MNKTVHLKGLRTVGYKVDDLEAAKQWYAKAFGKEPYFDEAFYVGFEIAGYELGLLPAKYSSPKTDNIHALWGVDDVEQAYQDLIANGAKPHEAPQNVGGDIIVAAVKDPWDNVIGLIYNPHFKLSE